MEHMLFIIQYTVKKSISSVFDDLRHRRPVVQPDSPAASQESFHTISSISIVSSSKAPPSGRGVYQLSDDNGFEYHLKTFCGQSMTPEYSECVHCRDVLDEQMKFCLKSMKYSSQRLTVENKSKIFTGTVDIHVEIIYRL